MPERGGGEAGPLLFFDTFFLHVRITLVVGSAFTLIVEILFWIVEITMTASNQDLDRSVLLPYPVSELSDVSSTATKGKITGEQQKEFAKDKNNLREEFLTYRGEQNFPYLENSPYLKNPQSPSLTGSPLLNEQRQKDTQELKSALKFDLVAFLEAKEEAGISKVDALVEAKAQIVLRAAIMSSYNSSQITKEQVFAMLNGTADEATKEIVKASSTIEANPELSPSLNLDAYKKDGVTLIGARDAKGDPVVFERDLRQYLNGRYQEHLNALATSATYFGPNSGFDPNNAFAGAMYWVHRARGLSEGGGIGTTNSTYNSQQTAVSSGNDATDIIDQAAAISKAWGDLDAARKTLASKYGINNISDAKEWKKLVGGRPIYYSEELYAALFKDGVLPKGKEEINKLISGGTLNLKLQPMVQAYAQLDPAMQGKVADALSLAHTVNHLTEEINKSRENFQARYTAFERQYSSSLDKKGFIALLEDEKSGDNAMKKLPLQLIRDMNQSNAAPDVVAASEHPAIRAFAKDLGLKGFDQDFSTLTNQQNADLVKEAEKLVRAAEYVRLKNDPGTISLEQLERLKKDVGIEESLLEKAVTKYRRDKAITHLGDLCSPGVFALEAGAALQKV
jgi:hypothetical protein